MLVHKTHLLCMSRAEAKLTLHPVFPPFFRLEQFRNKYIYIYNIVSIDSACSVQSADDDTRNVSMLDKDFVSLFDIDYDKFTQEEADGIKNMLLKHKSLFAFNDHKLGYLKDVKYHMELNDPTPVQQRYRPLHLSLRDQVHKQLQTMLQSGVISENTSPWNSPLIVAKKKDGSLRLCVDFRCLNAQAKRDAKHCRELMTLYHYSMATPSSVVWILSPVIGNLCWMMKENHLRLFLLEVRPSTSSTEFLLATVHLACVSRS